MIIDPKAETYAARYSVSEPALLRELRETTTRELEYDNMLSGPVVGALLQILVMLSGARNVLEVGMFTGYGTLWMAMGLPPDGRITTCEANEKYERIARRFFERFEEECRMDAERRADTEGRADAEERADTEGRVGAALQMDEKNRTPGSAGPEIRILSGPALETLPDLLAGGKSSNINTASETTPQQFDLIFIDADKEQYPDYYELLMPALRPGGLMVIDNAFWGGKVWKEQQNIVGKKQDEKNRDGSDQSDIAGGGLDRKTQAVDRLNRIISKDPQVHNVLLTVRDGLHLVRKKV